MNETIRSVAKLPWRRTPVSGELAPYWRQRRYYDVVATIQIKNVSDAAHTVLRQRAAAAGQSLQEYMLAWIERAASRPTVDEVLDRVGHRSGGCLSPTDVVRQLREERDRR
jgi:antitoxin FitA